MESKSLCSSSAESRTVWLTFLISWVVFHEQKQNLLQIERDAARLRE
jgi:hypothetical protein